MRSGYVDWNPLSRLVSLSSCFFIFRFLKKNACYQAAWRWRRQWLYTVDTELFDRCVVALSVLWDLLPKAGGTWDVFDGRHWRPCITGLTDGLPSFHFIYFSSAGRRCCALWPPMWDIKTWMPFSLRHSTWMWCAFLPVKCSSFSVLVVWFFDAKSTMKRDDVDCWYPAACLWQVIAFQAGYDWEFLCAHV